jgi:hypothetical protein
MRVRIIFTVIMAVLLMAGTTASAICEMTCLPHAQTGACCPHHAHHMMTDCQNSGTAQLSNAHLCDHPQDSAAATASIVAAPLIAGSIASQADLVSFAALSTYSPSATIFRPLSNTPLRI